MPALTGLALVAAALLVAAGAQKLLDPSMTVGALGQMGLRASPAVVRIGSAAELALGTAAATVGGPASWWLIALSYSGFAVFVAAALRKGTMIGSCGCFGREDTPPHLLHVVVNLLLAAGAVAIAVRSPGAPLDALVDRPGEGLLVVGLSGSALVLLYAIFSVVPRVHGRSRGQRAATSTVRSA